MDEEAGNQGLGEETGASEEQQPSSSDQARNSGTKSSNQTAKTGLKSSNQTGKTGMQSSSKSGDGKSSGVSGMAHSGAQQAGQQAAKVVAKKAKSAAWKWITGGGIGLGGLGGLAIILFLLLLFKNVAIRDLFMDYEFAKFNRIFSERMRDAIKESDPQGTEKTKLTDDATPEEQLKEASAPDVDELKKNPVDANDAVTSLEELDQSPAGTGEDLITEFNLDETVPDETGETDEESAAAADADFEAKVGGTSTTTVDSGIGPIDDAENAADTASLAPGATAASIDSSALKSFSGGLNGAVSKISGPFFFVTLGCIAYDIYDKFFSLIQSFQLAGLVRTATATGTYADCQKLGKCNLSQTGAVAGQFDNSKESITQSAGYQRATGQTVNTANDLSPDMTPGDPPVGGTIGKLLTLGENVNGILKDFFIPKVCDALLKPVVQIAMAALNVTGTLLAALTGALDFGVSDVVIAAVQTGSVIAASKIGTALVLHFAIALSQTAFQHLDPIQLGNANDAGWKVRATDTCRYDGCRKLTPAENQQETLESQNAQIQTLNQQSIAYRLFDVNNPYSVADLTLMQVPSSPTAMIAGIQSVLANITNPMTFGASIKSFAAAILSPSTVLAAGTVVESDTYGIPDYGLPDAEVNEWTIKDNTAWVVQNMPAYQAWAKVCLTPSLNQIMIDEDPRATNIQGAVAGAEDECSAMDIPDRHFRLYTLDLRVTHDLDLMYNDN